MKRVIASLLTLSATLPLMWFDVVPNAKVFCERDGNGCLVEYSVVRQDRDGNNVKLIFNPTAQKGLCDITIQ